METLKTIVGAIALNAQRDRLVKLGVHATTCLVEGSPAETIVGRAAQRGSSMSYLLLAALAACATAAPGIKLAAPIADQPAPSSKRELPDRSELPMVVREALSASMERHGEELSFLLVSVVLLDYRNAEQLAQLIADAPKLGRPRPDEEGTLNALLPAAFFVHQDQLTERARALALAASEKNDAKLVKAFGGIAETCVGCHTTYLHDELEALRADD